MAALFVSSCLSVPKTEDEVYQRATVKHDSFNNTVCVEAPKWEFQFLPFEQQQILPSHFFLRLTRGLRWEASPQLYVSVQLSDWHFFHSAYNASGERLEFTEIGRSVMSEERVSEPCWVYEGELPEAEDWVSEDFAASLSRKYLEEHAQSGMAIRFYSQRGDPLTISVPAYYIRGFLRKVNEIAN